MHACLPNHLSSQTLLHGMHACVPNHLSRQTLLHCMHACVPNHLSRQTHATLQETGAHLPADALEVQVKDSWGTLTTTTSFSLATGAEKTVRSYGLVPGAQHHIWVLVVDDTDVRAQRAATTAVAQMPGVWGSASQQNTKQVPFYQGFKPWFAPITCTQCWLLGVFIAWSLLHPVHV